MAVALRTKDEKKMTIFNRPVHLLVLKSTPVDRD